MSAGIHGDELTGVKVVQEVADVYSPGELHGTLDCLHVCTVPAYEAQRRDTPIYDQDMNRSFPGEERSNTTERVANRICRRFVSQCDIGLDFHTSTRNRTTIYHARADLDDPAVSRLARAFATNSRSCCTRAETRARSDPRRLVGRRLRDGPPDRLPDRPDRCSRG